jgi:serine/threonine protein kinase
VLQSKITSCFLSQRALAEAVLTLRFELEKRAARNDEVFRGWMKCSMESLEEEIKTPEMKLPSWFLQLSEVDFEAKPFVAGRFGSVHTGSMDSGEWIVMKFFAVDEMALDERAQLRIEKELSELHHLDHPNVAKVLGASHVSCSPFLVSEDTSEGNLATFLARSIENKEKMWRMLYQAALGLPYLHKKGVVHGHLKLNSILVDTYGDVKLSDFGLHTLRACSSRTKGFGGGPQSDMLRWCAPECLERRPTFASDVYALGMCIVEAVLGEPPFDFLDDNSVRDIKRRGTIPERPEEMEADAWDLVVSMTNADPSKRIELKEVLSTLKSFAERDAARSLRYVSLSACRSCASKNMAGSRFCAQCGTPMWPSAGLSVTVPLLEASSSSLTIATPVAKLLTVI